MPISYELKESCKGIKSRFRKREQVSLSMMFLNIYELIKLFDQVVGVSNFLGSNDEYYCKSSGMLCNISIICKILLQYS